MSAAEQMQQVRESHDNRTADAKAASCFSDGIDALKAGRTADAKTAFEKAAAISPD